MNTPEVAPAGTTTTICVPLLDDIEAALPFNLTVAPVKFEPIIVMLDPIAPEVLERLVIFGVSETAGTLTV